jgi:hypothetical protein
VALLDWLGSVLEKELGMAMLGLYHMWLARNDAREQPMIKSPSDTSRGIMFLQDEWQQTKSPPTARSASTREHWLPPLEGWTKVNCDGAFLHAEGAGGGGAVLRDHHGGFLIGSCHFPLYLWS